MNIVYSETYAIIILITMLVFIYSAMMMKSDETNIEIFIHSII